MASYFRIRARAKAMLLAISVLIVLLLLLLANTVQGFDSSSRPDLKSDATRSSISGSTSSSSTSSSSSELFAKPPPPPLTTTSFGRSNNNNNHNNNNNNNNADGKRLQSLEQSNHPLISLNLNLDALAQSNAAPTAQELLQRIHALYHEGYYEVSPDVVSYNSVLKAWKEEKNPQKAYELLQEMIQSQEEGDIDVDVISFNTVILAFAKQGDYPQAEDILKQMQRKKNYPNPDAVTYNAVLYAFAKSGDRGTEIQAENLLKEMMTQQQKGSNVTVDTTSFNTVIHAWARRASEASPAAANRAQQLLEHMERLSDAGNTNVAPDVYSYTTVIQAWAKCAEALKSQRILAKMTARGLVPNRFTHTAVMSGLAKSGKVQKAEEILMDMMEAYECGNDDLKPDTVAFSSVIDGWAKISGVDKPEAGEHAMRLLAQMKEMEEEGMGPNAVTYTSVLTALAKSGSWDACEDTRGILLEMEREYRRGKNQLRPTTIHYNTVLLAYARSPRADKALKAAGFFYSMEKHSSSRCHPDTISYNSLLMSCANAFGNQELKEQSYAIALQVFKEVCQHSDPKIRPTSTTFAHFCKASRRLLKPKQQRPMLQKTLKLCCSKGLLNPVIVQHVQTICRSDQDWKEVAGALSEHMSYKDRFDKRRLPKAWTCNARR